MKFDKKSKKVLIIGFWGLLLVFNLNISNNSNNNMGEILANPFTLTSANAELPHILWSIESSYSVSTCYSCSDGDWMACQCTVDQQWCIMDGAEDCVSWTIYTGPQNCSSTGADC